MTSASPPQRPIASGFGPQSTTTDVMAGIDLTGRLAVVTGGYSGVGLATVRALDAVGASVVVPARRPDRARTVLAGIAGAEVGEIDLADLDSVTRFADGFLASGRSIDILVNGAGLLAAPEMRVGKGWELQWATNHLGHFALTNRLWQALVAGDGARVVTISSSGHKGSDIQWNDIDLTSGYDRWVAFGQSKTANALFALELDRRGAKQGVRSFSVNPGPTGATNAKRYLSPADLLALGWVDEDGTDQLDWRTPEQGAASVVWAATSAQLADRGGVYVEDGDIAEVIGAEDPLRGVAPHAVDPASAARLWTVSAEATGVDAFAS